MIPTTKTAHSDEIHKTIAKENRDKNTTEWGEHNANIFCSDQKNTKLDNNRKTGIIHCSQAFIWPKSAIIANFYHREVLSNIGAFSNILSFNSVLIIRRYFRKDKMWSNWNKIKIESNAIYYFTIIW